MMADHLPLAVFLAVEIGGADGRYGEIEAVAVLLEKNCMSTHSPSKQVGAAF